MSSETQSRSVQIRGKLKVFLGMCAGVGKTYSMLLEARQKITENVNVMIGYIETHNRPETLALLDGIPQIPLKTIQYRGIELNEMDLDGILKRKPSVVIIDELPHTNAVGSRHTKRYQDVLELLDAGIDVFTALNVQHIESRADVVQGITSVQVRETVPDSIIDLAEDIQLIDITPEDLRIRLSEGKVYLGNRAAVAADNFFRIENLSALREIAMRIMAEKVGQDVREAMIERHIKGPWKSSERYMVAVGPSPFSEPLIKWTRRIAAATHSSWIAVHVESLVPLTDDEKQRLERNLLLVRQLGGESVTIVSEDVSGALLEAAREHNVTQIVIGKPLQTPLVRLFTGRSLVDKLILNSGDIDVCVVRAEKKVRRKSQPFAFFNKVPFYKDLGFGLGVITVCTFLFLLIRTFTSYSTISLLFLLSIVYLATKLSRQVTIIVAVITGIVWNFFFIPPVFTFQISKFTDILMFGVFIVVALVVGNLTARLRFRELNERIRERRTRVLYQLAQCVVESRNLDEGVRLVVEQIDPLFSCRTAITLGLENGMISNSAHSASTFQINTKEYSVITWVFTTMKPAGRFTETLPESQGFHIPLQTTHGCVGVLSLLFPEHYILDVNQREMLDTVSDHIAALIERYNLIRQAHKTQVVEESEKQYRILFDCVSHELKTPLTILSGAAARMRDDIVKGDFSAVMTANDESIIAIRRLRRSVDNLLGMTRMESGHGDREMSWCDLDEVVAIARDQVFDLLKDKRLSVVLPDNLPLIQADPILLTQVVANLLANASQYSPVNGLISIIADIDNEEIVLRVADEGEGIPSEELTGTLFQKFHRGRNAKPGGTGLGLSIVYRFMELIGGSATAENRLDRDGAMFTLRFPVKKYSEKQDINE